MKFTVYTKRGCPYCVKVKQVLEAKEFEFNEYLLERDFRREDFNSKFGQGSTFPQVILDDTNLGGCTDTIKYLREQNLL